MAERGIYIHRGFVRRLALAAGWSILGGAVFLTVGFKKWFGLMILALAIWLLVVAVRGRPLRDRQLPIWETVVLVINMGVVLFAPFMLLPFLRCQSMLLAWVLYFTITVGLVANALIEFLLFRPRVR